MEPLHPTTDLAGTRLLRAGLAIFIGLYPALVLTTAGITLVIGVFSGDPILALGMLLEAIFYAAVLALPVAAISAVLALPLLALQRFILSPEPPHFRLGYIAVALYGPTLLVLVTHGWDRGLWAVIIPYEVTVLIATLIYLRLAEPLELFPADNRGPRSPSTSGQVTVSCTPSKPSLRGPMPPRFKTRLAAIGAAHVLVLATAVLAGSALAADTVLAPGQEMFLKPQTVARLPDGRKINFYCRGQGSPTAILESGWGTPSFTWARVQTQFAKTTRVCALDRAGYGFSDPGPLPRDSNAAVADLHAALSAAHLPAPYILVGHSLAGFDARLYAYRYPRDVAGLLLLDPPTEDLYRRTREPDEDVALMRKCMALAKRRPIVPGAADGCVQDPRTQLGPQWSAATKARAGAEQARGSWFETLLSEDLTMVDRSADQLAAARHPLGDIPLIVLQADTDCRVTGAPPKPDDAGDASRCAALDRQAHDSTRGQHRVVAGSRHYIYLDKPLVVEAAFREIVEAARGATARK